MSHGVYHAFGRGHVEHRLILAGKRRVSQILGHRRGANRPRTWAKAITSVEGLGHGEGNACRNDHSVRHLVSCTSQGAERRGLLSADRRIVRLVEGQDAVVGRGDGRRHRAPRRPLVFLAADVGRDAASSSVWAAHVAVVTASAGDRPNCSVKMCQPVVERNMRRAAVRPRDVSGAGGEVSRAMTASKADVRRRATPAGRRLASISITYARESTSYDWNAE